MRPDQIQRLEELSEKLADRFLDEADPAEWPGADKDASREDRGNAYWLKKNAMATGGVLRYTLDLIKHNAAPAGEGDGDDTARDSDMDRKIAEAEKRAAQAVNRALDKAKKRTFDERTLGKH